MADFQTHLSDLQQCNAQILAVSVDSLADTQALIEQLGLAFPIGYDLDYVEFATKTGAFYEVRRSIIHATNFILRADGTVAHAVYATGPIGRLTAMDCVRVLC